MLGSTLLGSGLTGLGLPLPPPLPEEVLEGIATPSINGLPVKGIPAFQPGNAIDLGCNFTDQSGTPQDPSLVTLHLLSPAGQITALTSPGALIHGVTGAFGSDLVPPYLSGTWVLRWTASGSLIADTGDIEFVILPSVFP